MRQLLKIFIVGLGISSTAYAGKINSFDEAALALRHGKLITFTVDYDQCKSNYPKSGLHATWRPEGILIHNDTIIARISSYLEKVYSIPNGDKSLGAHEYRLDKSNTLTIESHLLDPATHEDKIKPREVVCKLNKGYSMYVS